MFVQSVSLPILSIYFFSENSDCFSFRSQLISVPLFDLSVNHLGVLLHGETRVAPTFTVEDLLLLVLGPELC